MTGDNPTPTVTANRLSADYADVYWRELGNDHREEVCDLIRAAGLDPDTTKAVEYDVIDCPLLRFEVFLLDPNGRVVLDEDGVAAAYVSVEHPAPSLPSWWQPEIKGADQ